MYRLFSQLVCLTVFTSIAFVASGCGSQTYELRLEETKKYFTYLNKVNASLQPVEPGLLRDFKISLRAPVQYDFLPPPAIELDENDEPIPVPPQADERQRKFMNTIAPGLLGAWEAEVVIQVAEDEEEEAVDEEEEDAGPPTAKSYIYLLGNHLQWIAKEEDAAIDPMTFASEASDALASGFRMARDTEDQPWDWQVLKKPSTDRGYVGKKTFDAYEFGENEGDPEIEIDGLYYKVGLYFQEIGDIQTMLVVVSPIDVAISEKHGERVALMLEQLEVKPDVPKSRAAAADGAAGF